MTKRPIPAATVARLPVYLQALVELAERGVATVSSSGLSTTSGVNSANVRKDFSCLGSYGTRGVGYQVSELIEEISGVLGLTEDRSVVIAGVGNLGRALATYGGFTERGFTIAALVDADDRKIGQLVGDLEVESFDDLAAIIEERGVTIGVLATPAHVAQHVTDRLVQAGVSAILNFAPARLDVPDGVSVRRVDLSTELQILSFYERLHAELLTPEQTGT